MVNKKRFGQRQWRFSDTGRRFNGRQRPLRRSNQKPISSALKRGIIYCKRCRSRIVSNVDFCPFCGKSLRPFFARLWFWLLIVITAALTTVLVVNVNLPQENTAPSKPDLPTMPSVYGGIPGASIRDLSLGTTIDNNELLVRVSAIQFGPTSAAGQSIIIAIVEFHNQRQTATTLYATQWRLEDSSGQRHDTFVGTTDDGSTATSNFEALELTAGGYFVGRLYFEGELPSRLVYQPSALSYTEELLVTWELPSIGG